MRYDDDYPEMMPGQGSCRGGCGSVANARTLGYPRWDDMPDSPYFQSVPNAPVAQRSVSRSQPWDDLPDSDNFHTPNQRNQGLTARASMVTMPWEEPSRIANVPHPGMIPTLAERQASRYQSWDDLPDSDNFQNQRIPGVARRVSEVLMPWEESIGRGNFPNPGMLSTLAERQASRYQSWDDLPDSDNFQNQRISGVARRVSEVLMPWEEQTGSRSTPDYQEFGARQASRYQPWDDLPDSDHFYAKPSVELPRTSVRMGDNSVNWVTNQLLVKNRFGRAEQYFDPCSDLPFRRPEERNTGPYPLAMYYADPYFQTGAYYGRSVATLKTVLDPSDEHGPNGIYSNATGWLLGGPYLATTGHSDWPSGQYTAVFGRYGHYWSDDSEPGITNNPLKLKFTNGVVDLLQRLVQLGIPIEQIVSIDGKTFSGSVADQLAIVKDLTSYNCFFEKTYLYNSRWKFPHQDPRLLGALTELICQYQLTKEQQENTRDVSIYKCVPRSIKFRVGNNINAQIINVLLWPSNLFGHIPIVTERQDINPSLATNSSMYILCHNKNNFIVANTSHNYLSPGLFSQFLSPQLGGHDSCKGFLAKADRYYSDFGCSGSSFMVNSDFALNYGFAKNYAPSVHSTTFSSNSGGYGSTLPHDTKMFAPENLPSLIDSRQSITSTNVYVNFGGSVGGNSTLLCPNGFVAAGLVGSTYNNNQSFLEKERQVGQFGDSITHIRSQRKATSDRIGNLGVVCLPYSHVVFYRLALSQAVVVASGSVDVATFDFPSVSPPGTVIGRTGTPIPLDVYMNEYLSTYASHPRDFLCGSNVYKASAFQQDLTMCPPGYYMKGIQWSIAGDRIQGIPLIGCRSWDGKHEVWQGTSIGRRGLSSMDTNCGTHSVIHGIDINSGWHLGSIRSLRCQKL